MALIKIEEKYEYLKDVLFSILILCISIVVNAGISIKGLYQDDILMLSTRRVVGIIKYVFPDEMIKFRPVYWIVAWIYQGILNNNLILIVPINILIGAGIAIAVYFFAKRLAKSKEIAFVLAAMFAVSRFSYYNIGQFLGVMEAMALIFALAMLYFLYGYINGKNDMNFYYACIVYFINCFTHERFMVLFPMLLFAVIVKEGRRILNAAISIATFIFIIYIRFMALKSFVPEGTGGSKVSETFKISDLIFSLKTEILYILGINTGPEYLCGIRFLDANIIARVIIVISIIALIGFLAKFTYSLIMNSEKLNLIWIKNTLL